ncbi:hypothetical protein GL218_04937 [Daldinia childiae]|uniref:uncharacterized protein n=1 Tax=Daldinia childiae TaxID=326645 RepID=UPI001446B8EE|nr:uncharacterized protein GL218_04937 [Daldinia childiae]KAF3059413.1 hypothetical protein GL218_04937 [Daldinia childiae]
MASGSFDSFTLNINNMLPIPADPEDEITLSIKINRQRARREAHAERRLEADQRREVANRRRPLQVEDTELQQAQQLQQLQAQQAQIEQQLLQARQFEAREAQRVQQLQIEQQQLQAQQTQLDQQLLQARQLEAQQAQQLRQLQLEQQRLQAQQAQLRGQPGARESHSPNTNQIQSQDNNQPGLGDATTDQPEDLQLPTFPTFSADGFNSDNHSPGAHASGSERESPFPLRPAHHNVSEIPSAAETSRQGFLNGDELYKSHTEDLWCETEPKSDTEMD